MGASREMTTDRREFHRQEAEAIVRDKEAVRQFCLTRGIPYEEEEPEPPPKADRQSRLF